MGSIKDFLGFQFYENFYKNRNFFTVFRYPLVEDHLHRYDWVSEKVKGNVLDVACGSGWGSVLLAESQRLKVEDVVGIDINPHAYEFAKTLNKKNVEFKEYNLLDYRSESGMTGGGVDKELGKFDAIVAFEIIEHFNSEDVKIFLKNLKSFCKRSTTIYMSTPNKNAFSPLGYKWLPYHPIEYNLEELKVLLKESGYKVEEVYYQRTLFKSLHKLAAYLILFSTLLFDNKTLQNKIVKYLFAIFTRIELFLGTSYFSRIQTKFKNKIIYPKYFILKVKPDF